MKLPAPISQTIIGAGTSFCTKRPSRFIQFTLAGAMALVGMLFQGATAEAASVHVTGTVTNRIDQPLQGVVVFAVDSNDDNNVVSDTVISASDGAYDLPVDPGTYTIRFEPPCCQGLNAVAFRDYTVFTDQVLNAQMGPYAVSGVIRDINGAPIRGVQFRLADVNGQELGNPPANALQVFNTQSDGAFNVAVPGGNNVHLLLRGNRQSLGTNGVTPEIFTIELALNLSHNLAQDFVIDTAQITYTAKDQFGRAPYPGVQYHADGQGQGNNLYPGAPVVRQMATADRWISNNGAGVGNLTVLKGIGYSAWVDAGVAYGYTRFDQVLPVIMADQALNAVLILNTLSGHLYDKVGQPVKNVRIEVNRVDGSGENSAFASATNTDGYFIVSARPGTYRISLGFTSSPFGVVTSGHVPNSFNLAFNYDLIEPKVQDLRLNTIDVAITTLDDHGDPISPAWAVTNTLDAGGQVADNLFPGAEMVSVGYNSRRDGPGSLVAFPGLTATLYGDSSVGYGHAQLPITSPLTSDAALTIAVPNVVPIPVLETVQPVTAQVPVIEFDAIPGISQYWAFRDGVFVANMQFGNTPTRLNFTDTNATEGAHVYEAISINTYAVQSYKSASVTVTYDKTKPTLGTPTAAPNPVGVGLAATISATATDNVSGISAGEYYIGSDPGPGNGVAMVVTPGVVTGTVVPTTIGDYTLAVRIRDGVGNWSGVKTTVLTAVAVAPEVPTGLMAASPTNTKPVLSWNAVANADHYNIYRNAVQIGAVSSGVSYVDAALAVDGLYAYSVGAVSAGGESAQSVAVTVVYDTTAPVMGAIGNLSKQVLASYTLSLAANDNVNPGLGSGVAAGEYFVGSDPGQGRGLMLLPQGGNLLPATNDLTLANLAAGVHQLGARSRDAAGNWSSTALGQLTVVLPAPTGLTAASPTSNAPMLVWDAVPTATSYRVYRSAGGAPVLAGTVPTPDFTDVYVPGVYSYTIVAVNATAVASVSSAAVQVAVTSPTAPHANQVVAQGQSRIVPVFGIDVLPGLIAAGQAQVGSFDFDLGYTGPNNSLQIKRNFIFTYDAGGSHLLVEATNIAWLVVSGPNNTHGVFQGQADVTVGTAGPVSRPFTVEVNAGNTSAASFKMTVYTDASRTTVLYKVSEPLDKGKIDIK